MIKNYTSGVPANKSVMRIEERLVKNGANNILKLYDGFGKLSGLAFVVELNGHKMPFRLPARIDRVERALMATVKRARKSTQDKVREQAERTAWKLLSDWIEVQLSLIELDQAEFLEVFMPYVYDHAKEQTFFEKMKDSGFKLLEHK